MAEEMGSVAAPAPSSEPGLFQCASCKRQYKRVDHLARHVRSHTQSKPYKCQVCLKAFSRPDLLKRHAAGHGDLNGRSVLASSPRSASNPSTRVTQACQACASNHLRCTESKPCHRCVSKGVQCVWDQMMDTEATGTEATVPSSEKRQRREQGEALEVMPQHSTTAGSPHPRCGNEDMSLDSVTVHGMLSPRSSEAQLSYTPSNQEHPQPSFGGNYLFSRFPDLDLLSGQWTPMVALDIDIAMAANTELTDMDLRFLDTYNVNIPFEFGLESPFGIGTGTSPSDPSDPCRPAAMCTEAFKNSHWRFRPNMHDHANAEDHNLSLPAVPHAHVPPESKISLNRRVTCAKLGVAARDRILAMIVEGCRPENLSRAIASFPSVELLDTLFQYYLTSPISTADSFIHAATFNPNEKRPELLAAMAAAGAIHTADPTLTKLGYAIQECLRLSIPKHWERDNTLVRDLELGQAFLITLEIGIWSGRSRQVEIAESFLQPVLTMLRRDAKLRRSGYPKTVIRDDEFGDALRQQWHTWVHYESFKRLTFRMLQHDSDSSAALLVNPLISYAEVQLCLPESDDLWSASSVEHWKAAYLFSQKNPRSLALADILDNPEVLNCYTSVVDAVAVGLAVLSCLWSLSWELIQLSSLQRRRPCRWNTLLMNSRREEILKLLGQFRLSMDSSMPLEESMRMRLEVIHLHLHVPFEELQIFAGMEGPEQARVVYPLILEWVKSEVARKAAWHAGQVIRASKLLPRNTLQGHAAITVYHASLTLWVYGLLHPPVQAAEQWVNDPIIPGSPQTVLLDDVDSATVQRFIQFGSGKPCIGVMLPHDGQRGAVPSYISLSQPDKVMEVVVGILQANHVGPSRPYLVEKLIQLMGGLQHSAGTAV